MKRSVLASISIAQLIVAPVVAQEAELANAIFQNHLVLQRDAPIRIWGTAGPGQEVSLQLDGLTAIATADNGGAWSAQLEPRSAGGPYELTIRSGGEAQTLRDVLIGDVYLCSGQSNMEWPVGWSLNSQAEVSGATNDRIRMIKVPRDSTAVARTVFEKPLAWQRAAVDTVAAWSAVCYYFARELQRHVDVPLGLIDASWGGSDMRAWMDAESLGKVDGYDGALELLQIYARNESAAQRRFGTAWEDWWRDNAKGESADGSERPWQSGSGADWPLAPERLGDWKRWGVPELTSFDGMVWFRSTVRLTAEQATREAELVLGGVDEVDQTWINGHLLGNTFGWGDVRRYRVPASYLQAGENVVVTNIFSAWDSGGLVGDAERGLQLGAGGDIVPLEDWRYRPVEGLREPPRAPWESIAGRTTIYNAMIAPLRNLELRGALWYQGESNTGQGLGYAELLESMIGGWRKQFQRDLPFLVVQLAGFGARRNEPAESGFANVREAQRLVALRDPLTALATAVDVGEVADVHPPNKQEVGRAWRVLLAA